MRGGIDKGLCLLALLFVCNRAEDAVSSEDLKAGLPEEDSKSAALSLSSAYSDADSSEDDNIGDLSGGPIVSKSAASASAYANGGQALAQANAQSGLQDNLSRPGWSPPGMGGSSALAEAKAQASGGLSGLQPLPYQPGYDLTPYGSSAQAQAEALANSGLGSGNSLGNNLYSPGNSYPLTLGPESSSAQAKAEAQALSNSAGSDLYPKLNYLQGQGLSSAQAQAEAQALNSAGYRPVINPYQPNYQQSFQPVYPGQGSSALAKAQAQAEALSQLSGGNLLGPSYQGYQYPMPLSSGLHSNALADAHAILNGNGNAETNAQAQAIANAHSSATAAADAYSRVIPFHEYIMPHLIPGAENSIECKMEGQLHYFWSSAYQCLVCACIRDSGMFRPVCARCDGCMSPMPGPVPVPEPEPLPYSVTIAPLPPPLPQVTCSPLPTGKPFQNPLNPCQICMCRETVNWQGEPDVHIDCQPNPECVIPSDVTTMPPIPDEPVAVPLPMCNKFPPNVVFPHPTDVCKVCKCTVESIGLGIPEPRIMCVTLPECLPKPPPVPTPPPEPITLPPLPVPVPNLPEPIPWPPVTTPAPLPGPHPGPGPLPGPAPHESCRPYPPNSPFQHPWDECQVCVCTEAYSYGRITIEVNCFTKKSCCFEPPTTDSVTSTPGPYLPTPTIQIIDKICEYRSIGVEFVNPADKCSMCTCELQGNLITSFCRRSQVPECVIYHPGGSSSSAEAQASAIAQAGSLPTSYNPLILSGPLTGGQSQASAEANAYAQSSVQSGIQTQPVLQPWLQPVQPELQPWLQPGVPKSELQPGYQHLFQPKPGQGGQYYSVPGWDFGQPRDSQASASAIAEAQANQYQQPEYGNTSPFYNPLLPVSQGNNLNQYWLNNPNSVAEAEATANAVQGQNSYLGNNIGSTKYQLPNYLGGSLLSSLGGSQLGTLGINQLGGLGVKQLGGAGFNTPLLNFGGYGQLGGGSIHGGGSSALAEAEASANVFSPGSYGLPSQGSLASTEAKANAQSVLTSGGGGLYQGGSPLTLYQNPYLNQGYQASSASSKAQASASSNAQSQASASASVIRKQAKSAQDDFESLEEDAVI